MVLTAIAVKETVRASSNPDLMVFLMKVNHDFQALMQNRFINWQLKSRSL